MQSKSTAVATGISVRHSRYCPSLDGGQCTAGRRTGNPCRLQYRAEVYDPRTRAKIRETFPTLDAAKKWRAGKVGDASRGIPIAPVRKSLREAAEEWLAGAEASPPT